MKIMPVQKQTRAGQRTRFKAFVVVGDHNGHVGLGVKCAKEVATAIRGAIISAKLNVVPVRRGYWGNKLGKPHTVPTKITGKGGSVALRLVPAPKGAGIVAASTPKKVLAMAGIVDVYTASTGHTKTMGNFIKATFDALSRTYGFLTPDLWRETRFTKPPAQEFTGASRVTHISPLRIASYARAIHSASCRLLGQEGEGPLLERQVAGGSRQAAAHAQRETRVTARDSASLHTTRSSLARRRRCAVVRRRARA